MISCRKFEPFPLADGPKVTVFIDTSTEQKECDEMLGAQNLKKQFKIPGLFYFPDPFDKQQFQKIELKGYTFFVPINFQKNLKKGFEMEDKYHDKNKITF